MQECPTLLGCTINTTAVESNMQKNIKQNWETDKDSNQCGSKTWERIKLTAREFISNELDCIGSTI